MRVVCPFCLHQDTIPDGNVGKFAHTLKCGRCGAMYTIDEYPTKETTEVPMNIQETRVGTIDPRDITERRDALNVTEQRHFTPTEVRVERKDGKTFLVGHAAVFNSASKPLKTKSGRTFIEKIQPGAFAKSLESNPDIVMLRNHNPAEVLARTAAKTLTLKEDDTGLAFRAEIPDTTIGRDTIVDVEHGNIPGVSFGFGEAEDKWDMAGDMPVRTLLGIPLGEISPTPFPAYDGTDISVRAIETALDLLAAGETEVRCGGDYGYGGGIRSTAMSCRSACRSMHEMTHDMHEKLQTAANPLNDHEKRAVMAMHDEMGSLRKKLAATRSYIREMLPDGTDSDTDDDEDIDDAIDPNDPDSPPETDREGRAVTADLLAKEIRTATDLGLPTDGLLKALTALNTPVAVDANTEAAAA